MTYSVTGSLTVEEVEDHAAALRGLLDGNGDTTLSIDIEGLLEFDLLGLQLLYSVEKECAAGGKQMHLKGDENRRRLENLIAFCGLPPLGASETE